MPPQFENQLNPENSTPKIKKKNSFLIPFGIISLLIVILSILSILSYNYFVKKSVPYSSQTECEQKTGKQCYLFKGLCQVAEAQNQEQAENNEKFLKNCLSKIGTWQPIETIPQITTRLRVTSPNGGEKIEVGSTQLITWMLNPNVFGDGVEISIKGENPNKCETSHGSVICEQPEVYTIARNMTNSGGHNWIVKEDIKPGKYKLVITLFKNPIATSTFVTILDEDESDNYFEIISTTEQTSISTKISDILTKVKTERQYKITSVILPNTFTDANWGLTQIICQQGGYDLTPYAGKTVALNSYPIQEKYNNIEPLMLVILSDNQNVICAYKAVRLGSQLLPGIFPMK